MVNLDAEIYEHLNKQIKINELRYLSSGDDSDTFLCNEQYVVKVPKRDSVRISQKREFELYRILENCKLSYQIPAVVYQSDRFNIMKYIKGERITYEQYHKLSEKEKDALAYDEATFLKELHSIEIDCSVSLFSDALVNKKDKFLQDKIHERNTFCFKFLEQSTCTCVQRHCNISRDVNIVPVSACQSI